MKFLADEGIESLIVKRLREASYDVKYIAEFAPGISDNEVLEHANHRERILITRDKDFGELCFRDRKVHGGIVLNRLYELSVDQKVETLLEVLKDFEDQIQHAFTVIQPGRVRIIRLD